VGCHKHPVPPTRFHLPDEREGLTWKVRIGDPEGTPLVEHELPADDRGFYIKAFISTGEFEDGCLGEVFILPDKEGSMFKGLLDGFAVLLSIALQYGVPLEVIARKFLNSRFEPSGFTSDKSVPMTTSFYDFLFKKLGIKYLPPEVQEELGIVDRAAQREDANGCKEEEGHEGQEENDNRSGRISVGLSGEPFNKPKEEPRDRDQGAPAQGRQAPRAPRRE
jgi:hypothetical protein